MFQKVLARPKWFLALAAIAIILLIISRFYIDSIILRSISFFVLAIYIFALGYLEKKNNFLIVCSVLSLAFIVLCIKTLLG